jgi:hypothetical protein
VFASALIFMMSASVAQATGPSFAVAESQAHAGDVVHFTITGGEDDVRYEIEVADRDVVEGKADGDDGPIAGQFTMPDLGAAAKSVTVEADIRDDGDDRTKVKRTLQYLGRAPAVVDTPPPAPAAAPAAPAKTPAPASPSPAPAATKAPPTPGPAAKRHTKRKRKHARKRRAAKREHRSGRRLSRGHRQRSRAVRPERQAKPKRRRARQPAPRTAPLFDGVPEADTGGSSAGPGRQPGAKRGKQPETVVASEVAGEGGPGEPAVAILVPGLLGLAGFLLAAATVLRRRRQR